MNLADLVTATQRRANELHQGIDADDVSRVVRVFREELAKAINQEPTAAGKLRVLARVLDLIGGA